MSAQKAAKYNPKWIGCSSFAAAAGLLLGLLSYFEFGALSDLELRTWDWRVNLVSPGEIEDPHVAIVDIDQVSLDFLAREFSQFWPIPRGFYPAIINYLARSGARAVAFDILFTEQSQYGVSDDLELAQEVKANLPTVIAFSTRSSHSGEAEDPADVQLFQERVAEYLALHDPLKLVPKEALNRLQKFNSSILPIPELLQNARFFGNVAQEADRDGIYRHARLYQNLNDRIVPALPVALFHAGSGVRSKPLSASLFDQSARLSLRFYGGRRTFPTASFANIVQSWQQIIEGSEPIVPMDIFKDKYVFVGMSAPGLLDLRPTPTDETLFPGVEVNATILENIVRDDFVRQSPAWLSLLIGIVFCSLIAAVNILSAQLRWQLILTSVLFLTFAGAAVLLAQNGIWLPSVEPILVGVLTVTGALSYQYGLEGRQRKFIRNAFRYYVSASVIDQIIDDPNQLTLGGEKRELTIFFSDIAGFTSISESIEPSQLVPLLNEYLSITTSVILESGGTVDKYVGDAVVAFWNAPLTVEEHALRAVEAALECQRRLKAAAPMFLEQFGVVVKTRIGLNTGMVNVGNFGSRDRFNYTVIGDAANLASRLEGANKYFGTLVLISESTYSQLHGLIVCRKVADIKVVGRAGSVAVYEPLGLKSEKHDIAALQAFEQALGLFEKGNLYDALDAFRAQIRDPIARVYVSRIERDIAKGLRDWSHVWQLTEK